MKRLHLRTLRPNPNYSNEENQNENNINKKINNDKCSESKINSSYHYQLFQIRLWIFFWRRLLDYLFE